MLYIAYMLRESIIKTPIHFDVKGNGQGGIMIRFTHADCVCHVLSLFYNKMHFLVYNISNLFEVHYITLSSVTLIIIFLSPTALLYMVMSYDTLIFSLHPL